ncbi:MULTISPECIES: VanZ family protein [Lactobacillales]|uniref:VanZ family protein n=1 Tax=Lactobacillales TaxID=186826 RepID=UPI0021583768|nr:MULTISPECIES: VanZ family protein [Lactobacillales]MDE1547789.1 VanZ family protein [Jeotgalibaca caeni]
MQTTISGLILLPIFALTLFYVMRYKVSKSLSPVQKITVVSFVVYCFAVLYLTFFPFQIQTGIYANQTPWKSRINFDPVLDLSALPNLLMLAPLSVYYYLMRKNSSLLKAIRLGFLVSFSIEFLQFLTNYFLGGWRGADVADLVINTLGAAFGYLIVSGTFHTAKETSWMHQFKLY